MALLHKLKDAWQVVREEKRNSCVTSLRVEDRIIAVKVKSYNTGVFLSLKRASYQGIMKETEKTYTTRIGVKNLVSLEILYYTPHLKDVLEPCLNLQDLTLCDAKIDRELACFILRNPLSNTCTFNSCNFVADALSYFFRSYLDKTLQQNWISDASLSDAELEEMETGTVTLSEFEVLKLRGPRVCLNFMLRITDDKRKGTSQLCFLNCFVDSLRLPVLGMLDPEPLKAFRQVVQDLRHVVNFTEPWAEHGYKWNMSPRKIVSSSFGSESTLKTDSSLGHQSNV